MPCKRLYLYSNTDADPNGNADAKMPMPRFPMARFNIFKKLDTSIPAQMMFYLVSYDTSYCERKHQEMQRISNSQEIQTKSIFEIFVSLNLIKSK